MDMDKEELIRRKENLEKEIKICRGFLKRGRKRLKMYKKLLREEEENGKR